jgi:hypothetical protein
MACPLQMLKVELNTQSSTGHAALLKSSTRFSYNSQKGPVGNTPSNRSFPQKTSLQSPVKARDVTIAVDVGCPKNVQIRSVFLR